MHTLYGKPLADCSFAELGREWESLVRKASNLTVSQRGRLIAIERELAVGASRTHRDSPDVTDNLAGWR